MKLRPFLALTIILASVTILPIASAAPKISEEQAVKLIEERMEKEKLNELYTVESMKMIESESGNFWRGKYATEYTEPEPNLTIPIHKYVIVYMDGTTDLKEKKGIPRRRVELPRY